MLQQTTLPTHSSHFIDQANTYLSVHVPFLITDHVGCSNKRQPKYFFICQDTHTSHNRKYSACWTWLLLNTWYYVWVKVGMQRGKYTKIEQWLVCVHKTWIIKYISVSYTKANWHIYNCIFFNHSFFLYEQIYQNCYKSPRMYSKSVSFSWPQLSGLASPKLSPQLYSSSA